MVGLVLMTISDSKGFDGFVPGAACIGLGLYSFFRDELSLYSCGWFLLKQVELSVIMQISM